MEKGSSGSGPLGVATYGTLVFQLKDAHREASGTCDFVFRAMTVVSRTMVFTVCLGCLTTVPLLMLIMGESISQLSINFLLHENDQVTRERQTD